jgi:DNA-binding PadR family transcriptional regulator
MVVHNVAQDEYIPAKFVETILATIIKPQEDNLEAIKELTKSINELLTYVTAPPSRSQLYDIIMKNREVISEKIDECIKTLDVLLEKKINTISDNEKNMLLEIKKMFEDNKEMIEQLKTWRNEKDILQNKYTQDILESVFQVGSPLYDKIMKITSDIEELKHHNKLVLTVISVAFSIIMAAISYVTLVP